MGRNEKKHGLVWDLFGPELLEPKDEKTRNKEGEEEDGEIGMRRERRGGIVLLFIEGLKDTRNPRIKLIMKGLLVKFHDGFHLMPLMDLNQKK